jgi:hypothetical protein
MKKSALAVLEGKWSPKTNISVKSLFDLLSDLNFVSQHEYLYEMFCDDASLENIVGRMGRARDVKFLYVGAHGTKGSLQASGGNITRTRLRNILGSLGASSIEGVFLGSCLFGKPENAEFLLSPPKGASAPIKWLAGYTTEVDWIDSSVMDMLFWNKFFRSSGTPIERIESVSSELKVLVPGLIEDLGFCIYRKKKGVGGGVVNTLED